MDTTKPQEIQKKNKSKKMDTGKFQNILITKPQEIEKKHKCDFCNYRSNLKWVVRRHAETKHPENFMLTCSQCQTTLNSHPTLQRHFNKDTHKSVDGEEKREKKDTLSTQIREVIKIYKLLKRIRGEKNV